MNYQFEKYVCTTQTLKETLNIYGVAIIPDVISHSECEQMVSMIWDFFEHITSSWETPLNRNKKDTWREFYKLYPLHSMLIQYWGVGHAQVSWELRQKESIANIFAHLWNCTIEELLVSFDGLSFNLPPEVTKRGWNRNNTWYHTDQSFTNEKFSCVQSFITGLDINEYDATFSFYEGSHRLHRKFKNHFEITDKTNWYKLNRIEEQFYSNCVKTCIKCPKGSLVLWDSRTIHCGIEASKQRTVPNFRAVVYLCYMPRKDSDKKNLIKKQKAFNELRSTTHYPHKIKLFAKNPRSYGNEMPVITPINKPILNEFGKKLAGF